MLRSSIRWPLCTRDLARVLAEIPTRALTRETGYSRSAVKYLRNGTRRPSSERASSLLTIAARYAREQLPTLAYEPPADDCDAVSLYAAFLHEQDAQEFQYRETRRAEREYRRRLYAAIHHLGGVGPHRDCALRAEYRQLPRSLRKPSGLAPDDIAHLLSHDHPEFGIHNENELYAALT
jgi:hypothetical protein